MLAVLIQFRKYAHNATELYRVHFGCVHSRSTGLTCYVILSNIHRNLFAIGAGAGAGGLWGIQISKPKHDLVLRPRPAFGRFQPPSEHDHNIGRSPKTVQTGTCLISSQPIKVSTTK